MCLSSRCWRQMGSAGRYCLETKLAKLLVGGGAPAGVKVSRAKSPTRLVRCWNQGCRVPARSRLAHLSGARAASSPQLNTNEVSFNPYLDY